MKHKELWRTAKRISFAGAIGAWTDLLYAASPLENRLTELAGNISTLTLILGFMSLIVGAIPLVIGILGYREIEKRMQGLVREMRTEMLQQFGEHKIEARRQVSAEVKESINTVVDEKYGSLVKDYLDHRLQEVHMQSDYSRAALQELVRHHIGNISGKQNKKVIGDILQDWGLLGGLYSNDRSELERTLQRLIKVRPVAQALGRLKTLESRFETSGNGKDARLAQLIRLAIRNCESSETV